MIRNPAWTLAAPIVALGLSFFIEHQAGETTSVFLLLLAAPFLFLSVFSAVHHAEVIAHRVGQPFGSILLALAVIGLVLPNFTVGEPGPVYAPAQLIFVAVVSLSLYALFLFVQMFSHRDDFLDIGEPQGHGHDHAHEPPPRRMLISSLLALPVSLVAVVMLAEILADPVGEKIEQAGARQPLSDHSDRCVDFGFSGQDADPRSGVRAHGASRADALHQHAVAGDRENHDHAGRHSPGDLRRLYHHLDPSLIFPLIFRARHHDEPANATS